MEVHVLCACRKHCLVWVPAICSSPFASPVLTTLSVCSTVLVSNMMTPLCTPFLSYLDWAKVPFQHFYLPSSFFHYCFLSQSASYLSGACWCVHSVPLLAEVHSPAAPPVASFWSHPGPAAVPPFPCQPCASPLWKQQRRSLVLVVYEYLAWLLNLAWKEHAQVLVGNYVHTIWPAQSIVGNLSIQAGDGNLKIWSSNAYKSYSILRISIVPHRKPSGH